MRRFSFGTAVGVVLVWEAPAFGVDCTAVINEGSWFNPLTWDCDDVPGPGDTAIIPLNIQVVLDDDMLLAHPDAIDVQTGGTLTVCQGNTLQLQQDSTVDGVIEFRFCIPIEAGCGTPGELIVKNTLTIDGDGGQIVGHNNPNCLVAPMKGRILSDTLNDRLTLRTTPGSTIGPLVVRGEIEVAARLVNEAEIGVDASADTLELTTYDKIGDGLYYCDDGTLLVNASVKGPAKWEMLDESGATIRVATGITGLSGDVEMSTGTLEVDEDMCTTGNICWSTGGDIIVAAGKSAAFGGGCP